MIGRFHSILSGFVFSSPTFVTIVVIDGSLKNKPYLSFELQSLRVIERHGKLMWSQDKNGRAHFALLNYCCVSLAVLSWRHLNQVQLVTSKHQKCSKALNPTLSYMSYTSLSVWHIYQKKKFLNC